MYQSALTLVYGADGAPYRNDKHLDTKINGKVASHGFSESVLGPGMGMAGTGTKPQSHRLGEPSVL